MVVSILLLIMLGTYAQYQGHRADQKLVKRISICVTSPNMCEGKLMVMRIRTLRSSGNKILGHIKIGKSYFSDKPIQFSNLNSLDRFGQIIDVLGFFDKDQSFFVTKQQHHSWIQVTKYIVSIIGLVVSFLFLMFQFRISRGHHLPLIFIKRVKK